MSNGLNDPSPKRNVLASYLQAVVMLCQARKITSALSAASAVCDHVRDWLHGTPRGEWVSMGVVSDGSYGVPEGLMYSFPVTCRGGDWSIVPGE